MKVLVVDDSTVMRKVIIRELNKLGCKPEDIVEACDGLEACQVVQLQNFDLILMDWNMPNMLGIDAVSAMRSAGLTTPIMMVTTEGEKTNVVKAIQAGATNYLVKPFTPEDFVAKVEQMMPQAVG
jgi:two-component system, chemotaxis family, chemotaxis protein CheY